MVEIVAVVLVVVVVIVPSYSYSSNSKSSNSSGYSCSGSSGAEPTHLEDSIARIFYMPIILVAWQPLEHCPGLFWFLVPCCGKNCAHHLLM